MKRDLNLMRLMLLEMESRNVSPMSCPQDFNLCEKSEEEIYEHGRLLGEAGWTECMSVNSFEKSYFLVSLNSSGHNALNIMRPDDRWEKIQPMLGLANMDLILDKLEQLARLETMKIGRN
jgi:hypothetical protein